MAPAGLLCMQKQFKLRPAPQTEIVFAFARFIVISRWTQGHFSIGFVFGQGRRQPRIRYAACAPGRRTNISLGQEQ